MRLIIPILLVIAFVVIWACEKHDDDKYLNINKRTLDSSVIAYNQVVNHQDKPHYYKDSVREASLLRAKNVLSKHSGYELIETSVTKIESSKDLKLDETYIERIRSKKDTLCIKVFLKSYQYARHICGIEYQEDDKMNLMCKSFDEEVSETPVYYEIKYLIKKRKWSRLKFQFEGEDIKVLAAKIES